MALRLIEIVLNKKHSEEIKNFLDNREVLEQKQIELADDDVLIRILLEAEQSEKVLDFLEKKYVNKEDYRLIVLPVEATLPRPKSENDVTVPVEEERSERISREELYQDIKDATQCSRVYIAMLVLSTIVAIIGLNRNNVVIIIGSMLIAPLLGPNIALSLGTTLGDMPLLWRALRTNFIGITIVIILSIAAGILVVRIDPTLIKILPYTTGVKLGDILLALASGCAGALAFTSGAPAMMIGVMVAVALLPPLVSFGLFLGSGQPALTAGSIFLVNLICINLAGVITFLLQGIHPMNWWEEKRSTKATTIAVLLWVLLLLSLVATILITQK